MIAFGLNSLSKFSTISNFDLISLSSFPTSNWHLTGKRLISDWDQNIGRVYSDGIILIYGSQLDQCFSYGSLFSVQYLFFINWCSSLMDRKSPESEFCTLTGKTLCFGRAVNQIFAFRSNMSHKIRISFTVIPISFKSFWRRF